MNTIFIHPNSLYNLNLTLGQAKFYINYKSLPDNCVHKNPFLYTISVKKVRLSKSLQNPLKIVWKVCMPFHIFSGDWMFKSKYPCV